MHCSSSSLFLWLKMLIWSLMVSVPHTCRRRSRCCWRLKRNCRSTLRRPQARSASPWKQVSVSQPPVHLTKQAIHLITLPSSGASLFWGSGPEQPPPHQNDHSSSSPSSTSCPPTSSHERRPVGGAESGDITGQEVPSSPPVQAR